MLDSSAETASHDDRDVRLGRILDDYLSRRSRGEAYSESALLAQYPELAGELREMLTLVRDLRPADKIQSLINQGTLTASTNPRYLGELGPYKITGYLGRGGMGIVLKAYEESLNRTVALKILRPDLADDGHALTRFEREAKAAAALNHPNIVTVYAVGTENGVHYIAMEYVEGPSLADAIHNVASAGPRIPSRSPTSAESLPPHPIPNPQSPIRNPDTIRAIFRQLLSALAAAHEAGLIHRDVKSSNILLASSPQPETTEGGRPAADTTPCHVVTLSPCHAAGGAPPAVKLADFGLARMVTATTRVTLGDSILGTPEYMSPEQARGDENIDDRTDLYSAGVVLYELLTGRTPFRADTPTATIRRILDDEPEDPRELNVDVDPNLSSLALRLMAKRPEDRLASATGAIAALDVNEKVPSLTRQRRLRRSLTTALAALTVVAGTVWLIVQLAFHAHEITAVRLDPELSQALQVRYANERDWQLLHQFPARVESVRPILIPDVDGSGKQAVAAGLIVPLAGHNLFAFNAEGQELWRLDVSNHPSVREWPDCGPPVPWSCKPCVAGDLDGEPGDELVVVAHDRDSYATRVSIIDPRTGEIVSAFWHMGQLTRVRIEPDFFGPGRPGLIVCGQNNKLDGFLEPVPEDGEPLTRYDIVSVAMVLDPENMDGLGPPRTGQTDVRDIPAAQLFAYAFLNMPATAACVAEGQARAVVPEPSQMGMLVRIRPAAPGAEGAPWMKLFIDHADPAPGGAILTVDRNLAVRSVEIVSGSVSGMSEADWQALWKPIIQEGEYLTD